LVAAGEVAAQLDHVIKPAPPGAEAMQSQVRAAVVAA
jgi:hypothetical protein